MARGRHSSHAGGPRAPSTNEQREWPRRERLSVQAAVGEAAQGKCRWLCPAV